MPCQTVITCSAFEWNVEARCVRSAGWVGRGRWSECAPGTSTISLPAISWALRRILSDKYRSQTTKIWTRAGHRFIGNGKTIATKSLWQGLRCWVQWRSDFQSDFRVLKKLFWTFSYLYLSSMADNVISCRKVAENTKILKIAEFAI